MIAYMFHNKKRNPIVSRLSIRGRKLTIYLVFIWLYQKNIRLNSTHYFVIKIPNKQELQQIAFNHSFIDFKDFINSFKKCAVKPYFLSY